jgi:hypothetical protein
MSVKILLQRMMFLMVAIMASMALVACLEDEGNDPDDPDNGGGGISGKRVKTRVRTSTMPISDWTKMEYSYNSDGTLKQVDWYDASSKLVRKEVITSNPDGTWNKRVATDYVNGGEVITNFTHDANKKPLKATGTTSVAGVVVTSTIDYTFQNGRKIREKQVTGSMTETLFEFSYDTDGKRTKTIATMSYGVTVEYTRTYNSDGTLQKLNYTTGNQPFTETFTWENGKTTVNMDDIWPW